MTISIDRTISLGFGLALAILIAIAVFSYRSTTGLIETGTWVAHTHEAIDNLDDLLVEMLEAESAVRGYVMAGEEYFLEPYYAATRRVEETVSTLKQLTADNPRQQQLVAALQVPIAEKLASLSLKTELRKHKGLQPALEVLLTGRGHKLMDDIRSFAGAMRAEEKALLRQRTVQAARDGRNSTIALIAGSLLSVAILSLIYFHLLRQIARRRRSEQRLIHLNRLYAVLSQANQAIVRVRERDRLFREICRIAVEHGFLKMAWVGLVDHDTGLVAPTAHWGFEDGYLNNLRISVNDHTERRVPVGAALRDGRHFICNDIRTDPHFGPWRDEATLRGYAASAVFPIQVEGRVIGAFGLYAPDAGFFDDEVVALLDEVSSDISFALEAMEEESRRRRAEEVLRQQAQILDQVHDSIVATDLDGFVTSWNKGAERVFGYPADQALRRHISFVYADEERDFLEREVIAPLKQKGTHEAEVGMRRQTGEYFYAHLSLSLLHDERGEAVGMIGYSIDISEAKRVEQALRDSEERFRQMAENIQEVFWMADGSQSRMLYASPAYERVWGRTCDSAYREPRSFLDAIHSEDRDRVLAAFERQLREGEFDEEFRIVRPDGSVRWVWDRAFPIRDEFGRIYRFTGIAQDITERKQAELELRSRAAQQRAVAELGQHALKNNALDSLFDETVKRVAAVLDVEYCKVLELLPEGRTLLLRAGTGWSEGCVGHVAVDAGQDSQAGYTLLSKAPVIVDDLKKDTRFKGPQLLVDHGVVSGVSVIIGDQHKPFGVLGAHSTRRRTFTEDDTHFLQAVAGTLAATIERKRAEEEIRSLNADLERRIEERTAQLAEVNQELAQSNEELARASRMKSEFLARMSHELRTPMNAIIGFSDLLAEESAGPLNERYKRFVEHIRGGAQHLLDLINDVLDLSRIEAGRIELYCREIGAAEALSEVLSVIQPLAEAKKLRIESGLSSEFRVYADRTRFKQVLYNLLSNAVKFTPEGGRIWIEAERRGEEIAIAVGDTGIGIPPDEHDAIFDEFHQVGATTKGVKEGTGLGLAITKRLVELQTGRIEVESAPGNGSRFTFTLPVSGAERQTQNPPDRAMGSTGTFL